ncbi:hypothetical protein BDN72DRAFT_202052 [Pluteus cervinus]|uniref:Uncharacterized protein n=1 Tax=Pluteus cervinus TaxID=181527 RepID=A0ACD3B6V8_9AGAR|nr:hypothetical protein BDN72DRAFT_202052 [Pluteus cervinus]
MVFSTGRSVICGAVLLVGHQAFAPPDILLVLNRYQLLRFLISCLLYSATSGTHDLAHWYTHGRLIQGVPSST